MPNFISPVAGKPLDSSMDSDDIVDDNKDENEETGQNVACGTCPRPRWTSGC